VLCVEGGQVAIFDATNTTKERRQLLVRGCVCVGGGGCYHCSDGEGEKRGRVWGTPNVSAPNPTLKWF